jgi:hypothetical protein
MGSSKLWVLSFVAAIALPHPSARAGGLGKVVEVADSYADEPARNAIAAHLKRLGYAGATAAQVSVLDRAWPEGSNAHGDVRVSWQAKVLINGKVAELGGAASVPFGNSPANTLEFYEYSSRISVTRQNDVARTHAQNVADLDKLREPAEADGETLVMKTLGSKLAPSQLKLEDSSRSFEVDEGGRLSKANYEFVFKHKPAWYRPAQRFTVKVVRPAQGAGTASLVTGTKK